MNQDLDKITDLNFYALRELVRIRSERNEHVCNFRKTSIYVVYSQTLLTPKQLNTFQEINNFVFAIFTGWVSRMKSVQAFLFSLFSRRYCFSMRRGQNSNGSMWGWNVFCRKVYYPCRKHILKMLIVCKFKSCSTCEAWTKNFVLLIGLMIFKNCLSVFLHSCVFHVNFLFTMFRKWH